MHLSGLHIDGGSSVPVYRQIADGVRAAAEAAIGLAIIISLLRNRMSIHVEEITEMKG